MKLFAGKSRAKPDAVFLFFREGEKEFSPVAAQIDRLTKGGIKRIFGLGFKGKRKESELIAVTGARWPLAVLLGVGEREKLDGEAFREAAAAGLKRICKYSVKSVEVELIDVKGSLISLEEEARAVGEACWFSTYQYQEFKAAERKAPAQVWLLGDAAKTENAAKRASVVGEEHCFVRDLVNQPGSVLYPEQFAELALKSARAYGLKAKVYDEKALKKMGYNGILRVGQGSRRPARLVTLEYRGATGKKPLIGLVGKGVTFDSGGISLKGPEGMERMKDDMAGAAAVLGVLRAVARFKLKINLVGVLPLAENMPGGGAQRPGDIIRMADGTTVEVISTDAEGRLILADGLYHCRKFKPSQMIDIATLTGACKIALGRFAIGLMGNDEKLLTSLSQAGLLAGERCWTLPLWDEYKELIRGTVSDLRNGSWGREAGTIIGGVFLKHFVADTPWAHLDIAGTAWAEEAHPYLGKGPTGKGLRLLVSYLEGLEK